MAREIAESKPENRVEMVADGEIIVADEEIIVADVEIIVAGLKINIADGEIIVADVEIIVADVEIIVADAEIIVAYRFPTLKRRAKCRGKAATRLNAPFFWSRPAA